MKEQLIYEHGQPYGIRDVNGFLFMFTKVTKFSNQEERYRRELADKVQLADDLLSFLKERASGKESASIAQQTEGKINLDPIPCNKCGSLKHVDLSCLNGCDD